MTFCKNNGISFYAVNKSYPEENFDESLSRKILADIFIDDRNIGGMMGWGEIYQIISKKTGSKNPKQFKKKKNRFFGRL